MKRMKKVDDKRYEWFEEYYSPITGKKEIANEEKLEKFCIDLFKFCFNNPYATITSFCQSQGIPTTTFYSWKKRFPILQAAYEESMVAVGDALEIAGRRGNVNPTIVLRTLPIYLERWKEVEEWHAQVTGRNQSKEAGTVRVVVESVSEANNGNSSAPRQVQAETVPDTSD